MKKRILCALLCASGSLLAACSDSDYDLSKIQTDNITIGDDSSVTEMPLVTIQVPMSEIVNDQTNILALCAKADKWLPSRLPDGLEYLDLTRIEDPLYTGELFDTLLAEMNDNPQKLDVVATLIVEEYASKFTDLIGVPASNPEQFKKAFKMLYANPDVLHQLRESFVDYFATDLRVDPLRYQIGNIDISDEIVDMIADNLDPEGMPDPVNTLHFAGEVVCKLPISMQARPTFTSVWGSDIVAFDIRVDATREVNEIPESDDTRVYAEGLRQIVRGADVLIPILFERYYPGDTEFLNTPVDDPSPQVAMKIYAIKRGGIKFNL